MNFLDTVLSKYSRCLFTSLYVTGVFMYSTAQNFTITVLASFARTNSAGLIWNCRADKFHTPCVSPLILFSSIHFSLSLGECMVVNKYFLLIIILVKVKRLPSFNLSLNCSHSKTRRKFSVVVQVLITLVNPEKQL